MNIYLDQNLPTQPNNCRFLRKNGQRPFHLSEQLTLSVMPDWKNKKFGPEEVQKVVFCLKKKPLYPFYLFFMTFRLKTDIWRAEMNLDTLTLLCLSTNSMMKSLFKSKLIVKSDTDLKMILATHGSQMVQWLTVLELFFTFHAGKHNSFPWLSTTLGYFMLLANLGFFSEILTKISLQLNPI